MQLSTVYQECPFDGQYVKGNNPLGVIIQKYLDCIGIIDVLLGESDIVPGPFYKSIFVPLYGQG